MRKLLKNAHVSVVIAVLLASVFAVLPAEIKASPGPRIYMDDPYGPDGQYIFTTSNVITPFNVTIWVESAEPFDMNMFQTSMTTATSM